MEEKTVKSMNLALERPTERLYVLIPTEMERLLNEKAKEMNNTLAKAPTSRPGYFPERNYLPTTGICMLFTSEPVFYSRIYPVWKNAIL